MNRVVTTSVEAATAADDLYISEIIEGSSLNKAVELFNPTGALIDLSGYALRVFFNGNAAAGTTVALDGVIEPGETFVIADDGADPAILDVADQLTTSSLFNGDDAIVLFKGDAVVDAFGQIGTDPGSEWPGGGQNDTLRRKEAIQTGDTDATDAFDAAAEWDAFPQNDFGDLGQRTGPDAQPTVINEVLGSTTGGDSEYIELFGAPGASLAGLSLIIVESDAGASNGTIDRRIDFADGDRLGDNGFYLLANAQAAQTYGLTPNADFAANFIENSSYTLALVETASLSGDAVSGAEIVRDAVAVTDGGAEDDFFFDAPVVGPDGSFLPAGAGRDVDGTGAFQILNFFNESPPNTPTAGTFDGGDGGDGGDSALVATVHEVQGETNLADGAAVGVPGAADESPLLGQLVQVQGVVTQLLPELGGFYLQEEDTDADANPFTSEGVFVASDAAVSAGAVVTVTGTVEEVEGETRIAATQPVVIENGEDNRGLVTPTEIAFPTATVLQDADGDFVANLEAFEGMLVSVSSEMSVTELFQLDRFGTIRVSSDGRLEQFTQDNAPDVDGFAQHLRDVAARSLIIDDGSDAQNPETILVPDLGGDGTLDAGDVFRMGDVYTDLVGVLSYGEDNQSGSEEPEYRLHAPEAALAQTNPRPFTPDAIDGDFRVASLNVLNFFTTLDEFPSVGEGTGPNGASPRGADANPQNARPGFAATDEYDRQLSKLVEAFTLMDADVVGLVEIENDFRAGGDAPVGDGTVIGSGVAAAELVAALNAAQSARVYDFVDPGDEFAGGDAIAVGFIYDTLTTTQVGEAAILTEFNGRDFIDPNDTTDGGRNRAALAVSFEETATSGRFTASVNHFKSKGPSGLSAGDAADPDSDQGDGAGFWNDTRTQAAEILADWLATNPTGAADGDVIILGDLNAYAMETPITTLTAAGYTDLAGLFLEDGYSFVFDGQRGTLDYALANDAMLGQVAGVTEWHVNADEADAFDYNLEFGRDPALFTTDADTNVADGAYRNSDHDPIIVGLNLTPDAPVFTLPREARSEALGGFDESAAESIAHENGRFFVTNSDAGRVDVLEQDGDALVKVGDLPLDGGPNSVAVKNGVVAVAVDLDGAPGAVALFDAATLEPLATLSLATGVDGEGVLPDMLTFSEDGCRIFVAIEGEPGDDSDPRGGVAVITLHDGEDLSNASVEIFGFEDFDDQVAALREAGVRIFPGKLPSEDFEPEYIAIDPQTGFLHVTLQEANAIAVFDPDQKEFVAIQPLGLKAHGDPDNGIDPSDRDDAIAIAPRPGVVGMFMPDAIASFVAADGKTYFATANEGDARNEDDRVKDLALDPTVFPNAAALQQDENLGRLEVSTIDGDTDGDGDFDVLHAFGARSFSIYDADGNQVFDSGDDFERIIAEQTPALFNADNDEPFDLDSRSDAKGPEPEAIAVADVNGSIIVVIGLERANGLMFYDATDVGDVKFLKYLSTVDPADEAAGEPYANSDLGPEVITVIDAADSANGKTQIAVSNEVSGTVSLYTLEDVLGIEPTPFTLELLHIADQEAGEDAVVDAPLASAVVNALKAQDIGEDGQPDNTIFLSSGDAIIPGLFFTASANAYGGPGRADILIQNELGVDAIAFGNHEFDLGTALLADLIGGAPAEGDFPAFPGAQFPYLSGNLDFTTDANLAPFVTADAEAPTPNSIAGTTVLDVNGEKVGVIGATTPNLRVISSPDGVTILPAEFPDSVFTDAELDALAAELQADIDALIAANPGLDKVVMLSHFQRLDNEERLATRLTDVDIIVGGGSNTRLFDENDRIRPEDQRDEDEEPYREYPILTEDADKNPVAIVNTDGNYKYVGRLVLDFDENGLIIPESYDPLVSGAYATDFDSVEALVGEGDVEGLIDPEIQEIANVIGAEIEALKQTTLGFTDVYLDGRRSEVRTEETNMGNLTADANLVEARKTDATVMVSIKNGGGIRDDIGTAPDTAPEDGEITIADALNVLRFNNDLVLLTLTGQELRDVLEHAVAASGDGAEPGRFPQVAGVEFSFDATREPGDRIRSAAVVDDSGDVALEIVREGVTLNEETPVRIVTLGFLAGGGDGFPFPSGPEADRVDLISDQGLRTGEATFAVDGTEQDALAEYLIANFGTPETAFAEAETAPALDERIQNLAFREDDVLERLVVEGEDDSDRVAGSQFSEDIVSGAGRFDRITGGGGADNFIFGDELTNGVRERNVIYDFSEAEGDTITLSTDEFSTRVTNAGLVITTTEDRDRIIIDGDFDRDRDEFAFIIVEEALV